MTFHSNNTGNGQPTNANANNNAGTASTAGAEGNPRNRANQPSSAFSRTPMHRRLADTTAVQPDMYRAAPTDSSDKETAGENEQDGKPKLTFDYGHNGSAQYDPNRPMPAGTAVHGFQPTLDTWTANGSYDGSQANRVTQTSCTDEHVLYHAAQNEPYGHQMLWGSANEHGSSHETTSVRWADCFGADIQREIAHKTQPANGPRLQQPLFQTMQPPASVQQYNPHGPMPLVDISDIINDIENDAPNHPKGSSQIFGEFESVARFPLSLKTKEGDQLQKVFVRQMKASDRFIVFENIPIQISSDSFAKLIDERSKSNLEFDHYHNGRQNYADEYQSDVLVYDKSTGVLSLIDLKRSVPAIAKLKGDNPNKLFGRMKASAMCVRYQMFQEHGLEISIVVPRVLDCTGKSGRHDLVLSLDQLDNFFSLFGLGAAMREAVQLIEAAMLRVSEHHLRKVIIEKAHLLGLSVQPLETQPNTAADNGNSNGASRHVQSAVHNGRTHNEHGPSWNQSSAAHEAKRFAENFDAVLPSHPNVVSFAQSEHQEQTSERYHIGNREENDAHNPVQNRATNQMQTDAGKTAAERSPWSARS